jgi:hypothetical protein
MVPTEPRYRCPRHGTVLPRSWWGVHPSMGYAVCMLCRQAGYGGELERVGEDQGCWKESSLASSPACSSSPGSSASGPPPPEMGPMHDTQLPLERLGCCAFWAVVAVSFALVAGGLGCLIVYFARHGY